MKLNVGDIFWIGKCKLTVTHVDPYDDSVRAEHITGLVWLTKEMLNLMGPHSHNQAQQSLFGLDPASSSFQPYIPAGTFTAPTTGTYRVTNSGIMYHSQPEDTRPAIEPKCECGSAALGSNKHSDYCPLYKLQEA